MAGYDLKMRLGAGIRRLRELRNLKQAELAHRANIETQTLGKIERGEENACLETLESLCSALSEDLPLIIAPLATSNPADRTFHVPGRFLQMIREGLEGIDATPASQDGPYPPIKRRRRKPPLRKD
jgi:transcriptional regulator with XRE-family HTH domain